MVIVTYDHQSASEAVVMLAFSAPSSARNMVMLPYWSTTMVRKTAASRELPARSATADRPMSRSP